MPPFYANVIRDEIPAPREFIQIEYKGPNPVQVYHALNNLFRIIWEVKGTQMNEPDFRWDITTDPRPFFIQVFIELPPQSSRHGGWRGGRHPDTEPLGVRWVPATSQEQHSWTGYAQRAPAVQRRAGR